MFRRHPSQRALGALRPRQLARSFGGLALSLGWMACADADTGFEPALQGSTPPSNDAVNDALSPASSAGANPPLSGPPPSALSLIGGQTGSDAHGEAESVGPCPVLRRVDYALGAPTPLGFRGDELMSALVQREATVRWASGGSANVTLQFEAGSIATLLERVSGGNPGCAPNVLSLPVDVSWSSPEPGLEGRFRGIVFAESLEYAAGVGLAMGEELGAALRERSGDLEPLQLVYELDASALSGWLLPLGQEGIGAEIIAD